MPRLPEKPVMPKPETYSLPYHCGNCDKDCDARIPFGTPAPEKAECTHCGCETATRLRERQVKLADQIGPSPITPFVPMWYPPRNPSEPTIADPRPQAWMQTSECAHVRAYGMQTKPPEVH